MKHVSEEISGGRIRKARLGKGMTLKELAAAVDITSNHLSLVERGVKQPSLLLMDKVAAVTNVSLDWLRNGDGDSSNDSMSPVSEVEDMTGPSSSEIANFSQIDPRLFLTLIMSEDSEVTKENLAFVFHTKKETIDAVLSGENTAAARGWGPGFATLAQRLDTPAVCSKLRTLAAYLEREAQIAKRDQMILLSHSLQRYTEAKRRQGLKPVGTSGEVKAPVPYFCMQFQGVRGGDWEFRYVRASDINIKWMDDYVNEIMGNLPQRVNLFIVFDDKAIYGAFVDKAIDYAEVADTLAAEAPAGCPPSCPPEITAILVDGETYAVQEEKDCCRRSQRSSPRLAAAGASCDCSAPKK